MFSKKKNLSNKQVSELNDIILAFQTNYEKETTTLMRMFDLVCIVLQDIIKFGNLTQRSKANGIYDVMTSIEFVFILYFMIKMLGITDDLYQRDNLTIEHHHRFDIFIARIDLLQIEMNSCFNDEVVELLVLNFPLDPCDNYKAFRVEDIYKLMNDFYLDFTDQEKNIREDSIGAF
ncbi:hypothetical protein J1N35_013620 [Gossypium stocksii]|uniref:Uncharacterized protein n=1 Tax=Gossypium stocksii TaxID=47602 RepID=A0A9D3VUD3_9ROSI|nr:hypothetical protein J1N35_013620 [Gossypium stocksii]